MAELTIERARELLEYKPRSGLFVRKASQGTQRAGAVTRGSPNTQTGRLYVKLCGKSYLAHRLAWFLVHGAWPGEIDHVNGNPQDNRLANLRDVTRMVNMQNRRSASPKRTAGNLLGACKNTAAKTHRARITVNGEPRYLGSFPTAEAAHAAYINAKRALHAGNTI